MASDPTKPFDPSTQFGDFAALWSRWMNPYAQAFGVPLRYEAADPLVQEIAILATMHNMASLLRDAGSLKGVLGEEIARRAKSLGNRA